MFAPARPLRLGELLSVAENSMRTPPVTPDFAGEMLVFLGDLLGEATLRAGISRRGDRGIGGFRMDLTIRTAAT